MTLDPNDPRPMYIQEHYDPRPEEQRPNYGYDPAPKRVPEPHELPLAPPPPVHYQEPVRRVMVVRLPSGGGVFALGVILFLAFMVLVPIHASASADYMEEVMEASYLDFSHWDLDNPSTWTTPDVNIPEPSWFVKNGGRMIFYFQWVGVLLLFLGLYVRREVE